MEASEKREIMINNFQNPYHKRLINKEESIKANANLNACIDNFDVEILIEDDVFVDGYFDGEGCIVSTAAFSILLKLLKGKSVDESLQILGSYESMINNELHNEEILGETLALNEVYKQPSKKRCALLSSSTIKEMIIKKTNKKR